MSFTHYRARDGAAALAAHPQRAQSRIFQNLTVPDILKKVLTGLDVTYEIQGTFHPRDFCVQYRETDFNFASRLMEEEGIFYFFKHTDGGHTMVLANTPHEPSRHAPGQPDHLSTRSVGGPRRRTCGSGAGRRARSCASGKDTLWDHCFELPAQAPGSR